MKPEKIDAHMQKLFEAEYEDGARILDTDEEVRVYENRTQRFLVHTDSDGISSVYTLCLSLEIINER